VLAPFTALLIATLALGAGGCSKSKTGQNSQTVPVSAPQTQMAASANTPIAESASVVQPETGKTNVKGPVRKLSSLRTYKNADSGLSFVYPRKSVLKTGDRAEGDVVAQDRLPMGYVAPGGLTLALVEVNSSKPKQLSDLFAISANKEITKEQCEQFAAQTDGSEDAGSEAPVNQQQVSQPGSKLTFRGVEYSELERQAEQQNLRYYHRFVPGASNSGVCYEFGMLVNVEPSQESNQALSVEHKDVFAKLERILASVKLESQEKKTEVMQAQEKDALDKTKITEQPGDSAKTLATREETPR
jgi:hypothetical protein